jgi:DNA gyrase subunit A
MESAAGDRPGAGLPDRRLILGRSARARPDDGRGSVIMRAKTTYRDDPDGREAIIVTEVPYQVNKATMVEKIAELVREKRIEGIAEVRDESNRIGVRVVIELKRDAVPMSC